MPPKKKGPRMRWDEAKEASLMAGWSFRKRPANKSSHCMYGKALRTFKIKRHLRWEFIKENKVRKQELDQESDQENKKTRT